MENILMGMHGSYSTCNIFCTAAGALEYQGKKQQ